MNILDGFKKEQCCGCKTCSLVCPKGAILMVKDNKGFYYPKIDNSKCVNCGICIKYCDFSKTKANDDFAKVKAYGVKLANSDEVEKSRSGGFFRALAKYILDNNGLVYGTILDDHFNVKIIKGKSLNECSRMRGSKYVYSNINDSFRDCAHELQKDNLVLFTGLPCQVHSLLNYLKYKRISLEKLITCDIVCHGAPSNKIWHEYISKLNKNNNVEQFNFRDKKNGWTNHYETYYKSGKEINSLVWTRIFNSTLVYNESCFNCKYTKVCRETDFTIADFWGVEKNIKEFDDDRGTSLVILQNKKSEIIFNKLEGIKKKEVDIENCLQPQLMKPIEKSPLYDKFDKFYTKHPKLGISGLSVKKSKEFKLFLLFLKYIIRK